MKLIIVSILLLMFSVQLNAQNIINHIVEIDPDKMMISEKIEINTSAEYLFKIEKDLKGRKVEIFPNKYDRIEGADYDFLLFDSPKIEIVYSEKIPKNKIQTSVIGIKTICVDFNYNYLNDDNVIDYDPSTNNEVSTIIEIKGDYEILEYRFNPDLKGKEVLDNKISFKGNVNRMSVEIDFKLREKEINEIVQDKKVIIEKEIIFNDVLTLSVWDDVQEDGDVISLWLGEICLAKNLKVSKEKVSYKITKEMFGSSDILNIRIDNIDEGAIPPNTVLVELRGKGVNENMRINTTDSISKEIVLRKK